MGTISDESSQSQQHDFSIFSYSDQSREDSSANTFSAAAAAAISSVDRSNAGAEGGGGGQEEPVIDVFIDP